jgi:uncharacterized RDD family membrane protein YckC
LGTSEVPINLPDRPDAAFTWSEQPPDPLDRPEYYDGLIWRRSLAFLVDASLLVFAISVLWVFNVFTLFILTGIIILLWAAPIFVLYDTAMVGSPGAATLGMRALGLETRSWDGGKAGYLHAFVSSALFWFLTPTTGGLILLVGLFSDRRRQLHDVLSGTVVINARAAQKKTAREASPSEA